MTTAPAEAEAGAETEPAALLDAIRLAVAAANAAEQGMTTAQAELSTAQAEHLSRSMRVGMLLLDAKKLHPAVEDFEAFLKGVDGLGLSRAYDLMRLAGGRTTDEDLRKETRDRVERHRAKKRLSKAKPEPSVTSSPVTESAEADELPGPTATESADVADAESSGWENSEVGRLIVMLPYERAYDLSLWLNYRLINIRPEAA
jgi:hypothetical protein